MILLSALLMVSAQAFGQAVTIDSIGAAGLVPGSTDSIKTGTVIKIYVRYNNSSANPIVGISNGYRIYSADGAQWTASSVDTTSDASARGWGKTQFDGGILFNTFGADGALEDTVGIGGFAIFGPGSAAGNSNIGCVITIGPIPTGATFHHKHICVDSSYFPPGGDWVWADQVIGTVFPSWAAQPYCYTIRDDGTGVGDPTLIPGTFSLAQNYPNPFNPTTNIRYSLAEKSHVELSVYNVLGQKIANLVSTDQVAGEYSAPWDASRVASGVYFYRLETEKFTATKKMMLVK